MRFGRCHCADGVVRVSALAQDSSLRLSDDQGDWMMRREAEARGTASGNEDLVRRCEDWMAAFAIAIAPARDFVAATNRLAWTKTASSTPDAAIRAWSCRPAHAAGRGNLCAKD